jgi:hypothetical protein
MILMLGELLVNYIGFNRITGKEFLMGNCVTSVNDNTLCSVLQRVHEFLNFFEWWKLGNDFGFGFEENMGGLIFDNAVFSNVLFAYG